MKKMICVFLCVIALMLAGCQTQHDLSNTETDQSQIVENSPPNPDSTSKSDSVSTGAGSNQADENDDAGAGPSSEGDSANTDTDTDQAGEKDGAETDTSSESDPANTDADTDQADEKDDPGTDSTHEGDPANNDTGSDQTDDKDDPGTDTPSEDDPANTPIQSAPTSGDIRDTSSIENDSSGAAGAATLDEQAGERKLKSEGSLRGEIEVTHKLSLGKSELSEGNTVIFHIETKSAGTELKITLTGAETGTVLEGSVTGSGDISFEIDTADEYTVVLENCSLRGVPFNIDYSIGGS